MLEIIVRLPDDRHFVVESEGKSVGTVATMAATQVDAQREPGTWTLERQGVALDHEALVDRELAHSDIVTLFHIKPPESRPLPALPE